MVGDGDSARTPVGSKAEYAQDFFTTLDWFESMESISDGRREDQCSPQIPCECRRKHGSGFVRAPRVKCICQSQC
jgi:hypothetical protein